MAEKQDISPASNLSVHGIVCYSPENQKFFSNFKYADHSFFMKLILKFLPEKESIDDDLNRNVRVLVRYKIFRGCIHIIEIEETPIYIKDLTEVVVKRISE